MTHYNPTRELESDWEAKSYVRDLRNGPAGEDEYRMEPLDVDADLCDAWNDARDTLIESSLAASMTPREREDSYLPMAIGVLFNAVPWATFVCPKCGTEFRLPEYSPFNGKPWSKPMYCSFTCEAGG